MPDYLSNITWGETIAFVAGLLVIGGILIKIWKPVRKVFKGIEDFLTTWNGTEEVLDGSNTVIRAKVPGVVAQIEVLRDQLQNSHQDSVIPNLRDDLDTKATKDDVEKIAKMVATVVAKLDQHIKISKEYDVAQVQTAEQVTRIVEDIGKLKSRYAPED